MEKTILTLYYMADRGWLFMINADEDELFADVVSVRNQLLIMCVIISPE